MATSMKEYQKRWKEKQRQARKKQVTVILSEKAYAGLKKQKQLSGDSFSAILNNLILKAFEPVAFGVSSRSTSAIEIHSANFGRKVGPKNEKTSLRSCFRSLKKYWFRPSIFLETIQS